MAATLIITVFCLVGLAILALVHSSDQVKGEAVRVCDLAPAGDRHLEREREGPTG